MSVAAPDFFDAKFSPIFRGASKVTSIWVRVRVRVTRVRAGLG